MAIILWNVNQIQVVIQVSQISYSYPFWFGCRHKTQYECRFTERHVSATYEKEQGSKFIFLYIDI